MIGYWILEINKDMDLIKMKHLPLANFPILLNIIFAHAAMITIVHTLIGVVPSQSFPLFQMGIKNSSWYEDLKEVYM